VQLRDVLCGHRYRAPAEERASERGTDLSRPTVRQIDYLTQLLFERGRTEEDVALTLDRVKSKAAASLAINRVKSWAGAAAMMAVVRKRHACRKEMRKTISACERKKERRGRISACESDERGGERLREASVPVRESFSETKYGITCGNGETG
jgi:hypothetical protein